MKRRTNFSVRADIVVSQVNNMKRVITENSQKILQLKNSQRASQDMKSNFENLNYMNKENLFQNSVLKIKSNESELIK